MAETLSIGRDGAFEVGGRVYRIPTSFSPREVFSYRRLLEPLPEVPGGTSLTTEQRRRQNMFLFRRAAACVIPGLEASALEGLSLPKLRCIHHWLAKHRPELIEERRLIA
ncbi:MAG: hypothetical protein ACE5HF_01645 [Gemmatimonadota bacterium]